MSGLISHSSLAQMRSVSRGLLAAGPVVREFIVPVPSGVGSLGETVTATAVGDPDAPPIVLLGGISAHCYPCTDADGRSGWWPGLSGEGRAVDPHRHLIIGVEFAADERGREAPSTHDQARVLAAALDAVGVKRPCTIIGASYGGMVALALAEAEPGRIKQLVIVSASAEPHPAATAARELQRRVVRLGLEAGRGEEALAIARGMAMLTYRTPTEFAARFDGGIDQCCPHTRSQPGAYLQARGEAFLSVMSPGRFLSLSASIDRHRVDPGQITARTLLIGATSDQLVFPEQMTALAQTIAGQTELHLIDSEVGHDMFLKEAGTVGPLIAKFVDAAD